MTDVDNAAPSAPEVPATTIAPESAPPAESDSELTPEGDQQAAKPKSPSDEEKAFQKRLGIESRRLKRQLELEVRAEHAERQLAELRSPARTEQPSGEPVPQNFKDYESYIAALTDFKVDQRMKGIREESEAQSFARQKAEQAQKVLPKLKSAQDKYDDFNEVATSYQAPPAMQAAMLRSAHTGELYYYLGANVDERERISRLDDIEQVYAIRDLETKLTASSSPTRTPAPIVPNSGSSTMRKSAADMNVDEFFEFRRKRLAKKR